MTEQNIDDLPTFEEEMLRVARDDLVAQGYKGKRLMAALFERNEGFDEPRSRDFICKLCEEYSDPIEAAIDSDDVKEVIKIAPTLALLTSTDFAIKKQEIKERYGQRINLNDLDRAVKDEQRRVKLKEEGAKKDVADIARDWSIAHRDEWAYDLLSDTWRTWNGVYWQEQPKTHLLDKEAVAALQDSAQTVTSLTALKCFERLVEADCLRDFTSKPGLINFNNGTLDLAIGQLHGYWKEDNLTACLPYSYNPYGTHSNIDKFLAEVLPDEYARLALMAHAGLALTGDLLIHAFIGLIGKPRSGKSTILALINALCGAADPFTFAGHSIFSRDIEGKRSRFKWVGRPVVCIDELPPEALKEEENLKAMSAHGGVEMRGIGRDEHMNNRWKPKLLFTANEQPRYKDTSSAIKERAIFAEITQARPKEERNPRLLKDHLLDERGAFAASCIELAEQVLQRGYYPLSAEMKSLLDRIANEANPLKDFLQEMCIVDGGTETRIATKDAHEAYTQYCEDNAIDKKYRLAKNAFSLTLHNMHIGIIPKHMRFDGVLKRGLEGMRLRNESDPGIAEKAYTHDEPLHKPNRLTVVNGVNAVIHPTVNTFAQPVERPEDGMLTVLTVEDGNSYDNSPITPLGNGQGGIAPIERSSEKMPLTPLTDTIKRPVEQNGHVNGHNSASLTPLTKSKCAAPGCNNPGEHMHMKRLFCKKHWQQTLAR